MKDNKECVLNNADTEKLYDYINNTDNIGKIIGRQIEFVTLSPESGDWETLYMNGKLIAEGHSLRVSDILDAIADVFPNKHKYMLVSEEKAEEGFTENLKDMF